MRDGSTSYEEKTVWPVECEKKYERIGVVGKGSFGEVWMCKRVTEPTNEFDDEFVAIKNISIQDEKGKVYAEREIMILEELHFPNVIRLIQAFPVELKTRVVILQLARGPNLHEVIVKRGALGLPLSRLVCRQLIAAVSYLHGRAVLHRDIKPSNCILACNAVSPTEEYDWASDDDIWDNSTNGEQAVEANRWKLMLVDFGFARALEKEEVMDQQRRRLRNSIAFEKPLQQVPNNTTKDVNPITENDNEDSESQSSGALAEEAEKAALAMQSSFNPTNKEEDEIMGQSSAGRKRNSFVSMQPVLNGEEGDETSPGRNRRTSTARQRIRSMSALGTKAYAAPEIRKKLRHKTEADFEKTNAAMTDCVADYGMIVDAYSVGWTLRVAMTGIPPNYTMSEYMLRRENVVLEDEEDDYNEVEIFCCCIKEYREPMVRIRDPSHLPREAAKLISSMTQKQPDDRMTVREAQNSPWIAGGPGEPPYTPPAGDYPSKHGDPVVALKCAKWLSQITEKYHMN